MKVSKLKGLLSFSKPLFSHLDKKGRNHHQHIASLDQSMHRDFRRGLTNRK